MSIVVFNQSTKLALDAILNKTAGQNLILKLFKNDHTPGVTDTESDYTVADFTGYSSATLTGSSWTTAAANPSTAAYAAQTFTSSADQSAQTIYGYYYVQASSGKALGAERFASPIVIQRNNDAITITPALTEASA